MDPAFERIMDRCREGDREAFSEVVSRYGLQVLRTARLILRDEQMAEDVVQETFVRAWRSLGRLRDEDPGLWLLRIATNESISAWRRVEETARTLGQPVDTVKSRLKVALRRLRELSGAKEDSHE